MNKEGHRNLVVDIGNTRIKAAFFEGNTLLEPYASWNANEEEAVFLKWLANQTAENCIFSSVGKELAIRMQEVLSVKSRIIQLDEQTALPFKNQYETPKTLGKDRLAAVAGAWHLFPDKDCLVIDAGTCVTYDFLRADGVYVGGNIAPGLQMRLDAMHHFTARLPRPGLDDLPRQPIGYNTQTALQNGAIQGLLAEIAWHSQLFGQNPDNVQVVLTGGDAIFLAKQTKLKIFAEPRLVLLGLHKILQHNVENY